MCVYRAFNESVFRHVPLDVLRLLDVGCGSGAFGKEVKARYPDCVVVGITTSETEAAIAGTVLDKVIVHDLNSFSPEQLGEFDCVVMSHVLEHLVEPDKVLKRFHATLGPDALLIIALPNTLYWKQ